MQEKIWYERGLFHAEQSKSTENYLQASADCKRGLEEKCFCLQIITATTTALKLAINFEITMGTIMLLSTLAM